MAAFLVPHRTFLHSPTAVSILVQLWQVEAIEAAVEPL